MYGLEESSESETYFFYWASVIFVFLFINGNFPSKENNLFIGDIIFSLIYMIPTLFFVITLVNIKAKSLNYNLKNLKKCKLKILLMILGITLAIYISVINLWNLFFSIPIIITSIELVLVRYIEICSDKDFITSEWYARSKLAFKNGHIILKNRVSSEELEKCKNFKLDGIFYDFIEALFVSFWFTGFILIPLNYFHLMTPKIVAIVYIFFFLKANFIWHIIDCKFNLFIEMTGICTKFSPRHRGLGGTYKIVDFNNKNITSVVVDRRIYIKGDKVTVVYGALSGEAIRSFLI